MLFEFCNINKRIPVQREKYKNIKIGGWLQNQKIKINNIEHNIYKKLSENIYVKKSLNEFLKNKEEKEKKEKKILTYEEWKLLLFEFCDIYKRKPINKEEYKNVKIYGWLNQQKTKINSIEDNIYKQLSENKYVKISLDEYLQKKEKKKVKL